jgi:hypothetical protein
MANGSKHRVCRPGRLGREESMATRIADAVGRGLLAGAAVDGGQLTGSRDR